MKFFVTTPIYYVNDKPHLGHAYTTLAADILARYHRLIGDEVFFLTGTDEHGAKVAEAAQKHQQAPLTYANQVSGEFQTLWQTLDITTDRFIRTTDEDHVACVKQFLSRLHQAGYIYAGEYRGLYCRGCEEFKKPSDLVDGLCPDHRTKPEELAEPAYFFRLSAFREQLLDLIRKNQFKVEPEIRRNEVLSFLEMQELEDLAISRQNVAWGIPVPWDEKQTIYVWVDALINYYTAGQAKGFWPPSVQLIGKEILRFHAVIWPAMLLALGEKLPELVFVHGHFTSSGQKMSKSLGNVIDPAEVAREYGRDALRFFIFRAFPFGGDGDFSAKLLLEFYVSALANELGNLVQRVSVMTEKYLQGQVPAVVPAPPATAKVVEAVWSRWQTALNEVRLEEAYLATWDLVKFANQRIDETKPWELPKSAPAQLSAVLYELLEIIRQLSLLLQPLLPDTAFKISRILSQTKPSGDDFAASVEWGGLKEGGKVMVPEILFPRKD